MNVERYLRLIAGAIVLLTIALGYLVSPHRPDKSHTNDK